MKTKEWMIAALVTMTCMNITKAIAVSESKGGGGGDASEARVNEIRTDILSWIGSGGSKGLELPDGITIAEYNGRMRQYLQPGFVGITFVQKDSETDEELRVVVDGKPKTCRSYFSNHGGKPSIVCNIDRFKAASDSEQYRLVHHEFAGLAYLEKNHGAQSDYEISNQITDYLTLTEVLRLGIKRGPVMKCMYYLFIREVPEHLETISTKNIDDVFNERMKTKGYQRVYSAQRAALRIETYNRYEKYALLRSRHRLGNTFVSVSMTSFNSSEEVLFSEYSTEDHKLLSILNYEERTKKELERIVDSIPKCSEL